MKRELFMNYHAHDGRGTVAAPPGLLLEPAYSILPLVRTPVGNKHASPLAAILRAAFLIFVPPIAWTIVYGLRNEKLPANIGHLWLVGFALLCVLVNCIVWVRRLIGLRRGSEIHQQEAGYSHLAWYTPLPVWLTELVIVPGTIGAGGWFIYNSFSRDFGAWLMICGLSLAVMALWELRRRIAAIGAISDGMVQGKTASKRVERHEQGARGQGQAAAPRPRHFAEMASGPAEPPDAMSFTPGSDELAPERMVWFGNRRGKANTAAPRQEPPRAPKRRTYAAQTRAGEHAPDGEPVIDSIGDVKPNAAAE